MEAPAPSISAPDSRHAPGLILAFATAVVRPGGNAMFIKPDNSSGGWEPVRDAVASGRSFCVEVAGDILAVDCDRADRSSEVVGIADALRMEGYPSILLNSGQPGHLHLISRISDPELLERYKAHARSAGLDVRATIRPPLAPHRLGLPVSLVSPDDPAEALAALTPPTSNRTRPLSARMAALLREGDRDGRYQSRSHVIQALTLGAINADWTLRELFAALRDPRNRGGEKVQKRTEPSAWTYVSACWANAQRKAARNPAIRDREAARAEIARIREAASVYLWKTRSDTTDRLTLKAHLDIAEKTGKITYHADVRSLADVTGFGKQTISAANRRLRHAGWLKLAKGSRRIGSEATVWSLRMPRRGCTPLDTPTSSALERAATLPSTTGRTSPDTLTSPSGGDAESVRRSTPPSVSDLTDMAHDVWRHRGGLGKARFNVWGLLQPIVPRSARELSSLLHRELRIVQRHLAVLAEHGLAIRGSGGWLRGDTDLDTVATALGVAGTGLRQRDRHQGQRRLHGRGVDWTKTLEKQSTEMAVAGVPAMAGEGAWQRAEPQQQRECHRCPRQEQKEAAPDHQEPGTNDSTPLFVDLPLIILMLESYLGPVKPQGMAGTGQATLPAAFPATVDPDDPLNDLEPELEGVL